MWFKEHKGVAAACDENLLSMKIREGKACLEVKTGFYKGRLVTPEELKSLLAGKSNINLVGETAIKAAKDAGLVVQSSKINKVPYAFVFKV